MAGNSPALEIEELMRDVHGEELGDGSILKCDFCDAELSTEDQVRFDVIRSYDMDNLEAMVGPLDYWMTDAARCADCATDSIHPATDGWEEALVTCSVSDRDGVLSVDSTDLTVHDYSPGPEGAYRPPFAPNTVSQAGFGFSRWAFIKRTLETTDADIPLLNGHSDALKLIENGTWPGSD
jgi:hypothetical protein